MAPYDKSICKSRLFSCFQASPPSNKSIISSQSPCSSCVSPSAALSSLSLLAHLLNPYILSCQYMLACCIVCSGTLFNCLPFLWVILVTTQMLTSRPMNIVRPYNRYVCGHGTLWRVGHARISCYVCWADQIKAGDFTPCYISIITVSDFKAVVTTYKWLQTCLCH